MAGQDLIKTARDLVDAFNARDWEACTAALTADSIYDEVGGSRRVQGVPGILEYWQGWSEGIPDVKGTVHRAVASDNTVALELTWQGTHTGSLQTPGGTIPPTGKQQKTRACWVMDFDGGKVKESRHYYDMLSILQQLGVMPG